MPNTVRNQKNYPGGHRLNSSKSRSENEGLDRYNTSTWNEIEAGDVRDGQSIIFSTFSV